MLSSPWTLRGSVPARRAVVAAGALALALATTALPVAHASAPTDRFRQLNLVADTPGHARLTDRNLVNAWGLSAGPTTPIWVSDNGSDRATVYTGAQPGRSVSKVPLTVTIPGGAPTGNLFNPTTSFVLHGGGRSGPARFVFAGEDGVLSAWNLTGNTSRALEVAHPANTVWKGIALLQRPGHPVLLLANFHAGRVDVYDSAFHKVPAAGQFTSVGVPTGYAPFNVAVLDGRVYVSFAKQDSARHDDVAGAGNGFVNVYDPSGHFVRQLLRRGFLNSPWGMAIAPAGFGSLAGDLLVGNFGDGRIHAVDPRTGHLEATLRGSNGSPLVIDGLWGLLPGNGTAGARSDVWFSAGPGGEAHGLLGILRSQG